MKFIKYLFWMISCAWKEGLRKGKNDYGIIEPKIEVVYFPPGRSRE
jgi:hypothetical protein